MKRNNFLQLIFILLLLLPFPVSAEDSHYSSVKKNRVLYFGVAPDYFPFVYHDSAGMLTGLDIDLINEIGSRMDVDVEVIEIAYEGLPDALKVHQVDLIGGAIDRSVELEGLMDFSRVYFVGNYGLMMLQSSLIEDDFAEEDLTWMHLGVLRGGTMEQLVKTKILGRGLIHFQQVMFYETLDDAIEGLNWNEVDLLLIPEKTYQRQFELEGNYRLLTPDWLDENYAFASYQGSSLIAEVDRILNLMMLDGSAQNIAARYANLNAPGKFPVSFDRPDDSVLVAESGDCTNAMRFLGDVTIEDGVTLPAGEPFTKTWRVSNIGTCTWDRGYFLKNLDSTDRDTQRIQLLEEVPPGTSYEISVGLVAPEESAEVRSRWQMMTPEGKMFGQTVWVNILVGEDDADSLENSATP